jgi:hypothetical protein
VSEIKPAEAAVDLNPGPDSGPDPNLEAVQTLRQLIKPLMPLMLLIELIMII